MRPPKENFYKDKDHVVDFINKFYDEFPRADFSKLSIAEKFEKYTEKHPGYDCWAGFMYYTLNPKSDLHEREFLTIIPDCYLSLGGKVSYFCRHGGWRSKSSETCPTDQEGYKSLQIRNKRYSFHRALVSTFMRKPFHLKDIPFNKLQVNHKDGIKDNNEPINLEWVSPQGNVLHAIDIQLRKTNTLKMTLVEDVGEFSKGSVFYFKMPELRKHGFHLSNIRRYIKFGITTYFATWEIVPHNPNLTLGLPGNLTAQYFIREYASFTVTINDKRYRIFNKDLEKYGLQLQAADKHAKNKTKYLGLGIKIYRPSHGKLPMGFPSDFVKPKSIRWSYYYHDENNQKVVFKTAGDVTKAGFNLAVVKNSINGGWKHKGKKWGKFLR